jgi:hypothetical protein
MILIALHYMVVVLLHPKFVLYGETRDINNE